MFKTSTPETPISPFANLRNACVTLSLAVHALLLSLFLVHQHPPILKLTQLPGDRLGHFVSLSYTPGQRASAPKPQEAKAVPDKLPSLHVLPTARPESVAPHTSDPTPNNITGTDSLGDGDIRIASVLSHPPPHPDLNVLPAGTSGDVIIDVVIDSDGHIASYTLSRGLGHGIDETVLATIQHWTFQPATRNGIPIASEQELLFHYERG